MWLNWFDWIFFCSLYHWNQTYHVPSSSDTCWRRIKYRLHYLNIIISWIFFFFRNNKKNDNFMVILVICIEENLFIHRRWICVCACVEINEFWIRNFVSTLENSCSISFYSLLKIESNRMFWMNEWMMMMTIPSGIKLMMLLFFLSLNTIQLFLFSWKSKILMSWPDTWIFSSFFFCFLLFRSFMR